MAKYAVTGAAAVLTLRGHQGDVYLYTGAVVPENVYLAESVKNALDAGLLTEVAEEAAPPATETAETPVPYKGVKVDELKAEIEKRNADRADADKLSTDGLRDDLVAALVADDNK